ncbi:NADH dehydrogenase [ubiquinone] 1 alpha subcomplex subunit 9, mitochondrial [Psilocybe cubensis]|uniref:Uncharacterized protein n=2 Tax=Psilocybe cubensis TaxID=181762 RepID=A0A8H7Y543_PSICU|nr:NADH dehydrogenase [ubiquinone] 1 alpha subcomplex subunit 9, mitochondrial [Psilocybe cubensis]KAH9486526.1 NADH dehydrogenase [ubiquinone] 1 alpha subcomplex subunit 9, mitochondrial [Psilocybe cubensis]
MTFRVEKGGTLFRPVVKSRARTANSSRQASVAAGEQLRLEARQETPHEEGTSSHLTSSQSRNQKEHSISQQPEPDPVNRINVCSQDPFTIPSQPPPPVPTAAASLIGIPTVPIRRSTPIIVQTRNTSNSRPISSLGSTTNGNNHTNTVDSTINHDSFSVESIQVDESRAIPLSSIRSSQSTGEPTANPTAALTNSNSATATIGEANPLDHNAKGKGRRKSLEVTGSKKRKRRKGESQEGEDVENAEDVPPTKHPRSRASSSTPRPRKRVPSPPPYDPDADPGEDIDPTTVTMASLCTDTGQGRVSKKAAEILSNHAAWKIKNREKRARMKQIMEAKKYGREEEAEAELNAESSTAENGTTPAQENASAHHTVTDDTGNGFDYSQDLTTSRFNVQVRIGPNGETIIDENSLVVDRVEDDGTENYTHVVESDHTKFVNSGTYSKRYRGSRWSAEETELFYDALSQYGENYELIAYVLPGRDRKSCKNKFKVEDKRNHARINHCLNNSIPVDMTTLSRMTGKDFTGPVPEIRAPTPLPQIPPAENDSVENTPVQSTVKKRSRSKSHGLDSGVVVIGDAETFSSGRHIAKSITTNTAQGRLPVRIQISSRNPSKIFESLQFDKNIPQDYLLPPVSVDITNPSTLQTAFQGANVIVSLVGIMHGTPQEFERIQLQGAENVARAAKEAGAKLIHISAIGADPHSSIPYWRTKGMAENSIFRIDPSSTIIRPSLIFGPEDDFFNRFARLSSFLPFLPVFGGGKARFQPIYVGDLALLVAYLSTSKDTRLLKLFEGRVIEAGGPQTFTYKELMQMVLDVTGRKRLIISLPFVVGTLQGALLEKLPVNLFTVTRSQVEQLRFDNVINQPMPPDHISLQDAIRHFGPNGPLRTVAEVLPTYLH